MDVHSFASGPSMLPPSVVEAVARDMVDCAASGRSLLGLPFTSREFTEILGRAETYIRQLLAIPDGYHVLFLQGGASSHFTLLPMNLLGNLRQADYVETGLWSHRAAEAARPWCEVNISARGNRSAMPLPDDWQISAQSAYCHITTNETAEGLQLHTWPEKIDVPLVADMTADLLTRPVLMERFDLVYASAQKNLGAAGLTIVIVREDLLGKSREGTPAPLDYTLQATAHSKVNTPPTIAVAVAARMLEWITRQGGLALMEELNRKKSDAIYAIIDRSGFYRCNAAPPHRSMLNVCFKLPNAELDKRFLAEATAEGLLDLGGHVDIGGIRASVYNAVPEQSVSKLVSFMTEFEARRG
ncbi:MAG: 3-phosphoserine/phosphohydroxythreonine aminotransferase [Alphaproteobacteria bacterium BRH_c36]|nr:MAG: 3-phosphoserine/phosphohydroxythreonine aminotransferase [Alphaproteobacteria bacterium BRH_c36]